MAPPFRICAGALAALSFLAAPLRADDANADQALSVAKSWIAEIDAGHFEQSYNEGGDALHSKTTLDMWIRILKTERPPLGRAVSREELGHTYRPDGFEGSGGEFMTINYRTAFEHKPGELEYVVLRREGGKWRGVGYNFGPEQPDVNASSDNAPITTTTTTTNTPPTDNSQVVPAKRK